MTPPQRLRRELEQLRDRGLSFRSAWPVAMSRALAGVGRTEAIWWRTVWAEQRAVWAVSYSRAPWPAQRPTLFSSDDDHGRRPTSALVA